MHINYLEDDDLAFLPECSEAHLEAFTRILTHGENGKPRLSSTLLRNETFLAMEGHPERYRRNWQLIAGERQRLPGHHPRGPAYCLFTANAPAAVRHRGNW